MNSHCLQFCIVFYFKIQKIKSLNKFNKDLTLQMIFSKVSQALIV